MRTKLFLAAICFFCTSAIWATNSKGYSIKVKVNGLKDTVLMLGNHFGDKQYVTDTVRIDSKGQAIFSGNEKLNGGIYLAILPNKKYFEFLVTENQEFSLETDTLDFIYSMKVKDSKDNMLFYDYLKFIDDKGRKMEQLKRIIERKETPKDSIELARKTGGEIDNQVKNYKKDFIVKNPKNFLSDIFLASTDPEIPEIPVLSNGRKDSTFQFNYYRKHYFDNMNFANDWLLRTPIFHARIKNYVENLTYQIPDSISKSCIEICDKAKANKEVFKYCVVYFTSNYEKSNIMGMDAVFVDMVEKYYKTNQAFWADSVTMFKIKDRSDKLKPLLLGKTAPNLTLKDTTGTYQTLYNLKNRFTILAFWDPDCSHCKKEIPKLYSEFAAGVKAKDVQVYAVCTETERKKWLEFIQKEKLNWINVADIELQNPFRSIYDIHSTPVLYVLDKNKKILAKRIPVEKIGEFLDRQISIENKRK